MPDTYQAKLGPFDLEIQDIKDGFQKAIAEYEFPYVDGALTEDMGQKARTVSFRCYFWNDSYQAHFDLIAYLEYQGLVDLVHPVYGLIHGRIKSMDVRRDDRQRLAEIDITFVENLRGPSQPAAAVQVQGAVEDAFAAGQQEQMDWFSDYCMEQMGPEGAAVLDQNVDFTLPVLGQFTGLSIAARNFVKRVDTYVRLLQGTLLDIQNPANGLIAVIDYGTSLPGLVINALAQTVERYAVLYNTAGLVPCRFLASLKGGIETLAAASGEFGAQTRCAGAQRLGLETAYLYDADEQAYNQAKQSEGKNQKAFDAMGNYMGTAPAAQIMSANDYETSLALVRQYIEDVLETARLAGEDLAQLKAQALALLQFVEKVKTGRQNVIQVSVANPTPLHLICLQNGLDYHAAERVLAINSIKLPNFTQGTVNVYAG